ncbi:MAG TPA: MATE family efflux transporter [Kofleriaceae bacterium]|nr:MATE family efflux transporter [Kofleriaceae bacterium]
MPIIGLNLLNVLMLGVDSALCGRLPYAEQALTALGFSIQVVFVLMVAMLGLIVGTVALVARAYGGGDTQRLNHLLVQSTMLTVIVGVVVGILGAFLAEPILRALGASPAVAELGAKYLRPLMLGTPFFYLGLVYAGILRGVGNTRIPFLVAVFANVVNAVLNYGLILGHLGLPALGVTGSALGTVIAQFLNVVVLVVILRRETVPNLKLPLRPKKIDHALAGELFRIGWPAALDMAILNAGFLTALGMLGRIDEVTVAAHGLGLRVQAFAFVPGLAVAQATSAMVGQALGGGSVERARSIARASIVLCTAMMSALAILIVVAALPLVEIFDVKPGTSLADYTVEWMRILGIAMLPAGTNMALIGLLQGAGATRISLWINFWATLALQVPLALLLGFVFGLDALGVWLSFPIAFIAKAGLGYIAFRQEKWAITGVRIPARTPGVGADHG